MELTNELEALKHAGTIRQSLKNPDNPAAASTGSLLGLDAVGRLAKLRFAGADADAAGDAGGVGRGGGQECRVRRVGGWRLDSVEAF